MSEASRSTDEPLVSSSTDDEHSSILPDEAAASERTGVPEVDRVLAEIESVGELPVADRVEVFERAHERLRRALDAHPTAGIAGTVGE